MRVFLDKLVELNGWRGIVLVIILGGITALVFPPTYCLPILFVTFPLLLLRIESAKNWKWAFAQGYFFGFGLHTIGLSWLVNAILIRAQDFWWLVPIVSPLCAMLLGLWTGIAAMAYYLLAPNGWRKIIVFAGLWTICDMSRTILLPPTWWNPVLTGFPWNPLGSGWEIPGKIGDILIQLASLIGVDGLTLLTVILALLPLYKRKGCFVFTGILGCWIVFGLVRLAPNPPAKQDTPIVALIQGNIAEDDKINNTDPRRIFQNYLELTADGVRQASLIQKNQSIPDRPIMFAWPESSFPGNLQMDNMARAAIMNAENHDAVVGAVGAVMFDEKQHIYNSMVLLNQTYGAIEGQYNKAKLVPFGESQPWYIPFHVVPGSPLTPGNGVETLNYSGIAPFGPLICYEVIFSGQVVDEDHRPQWLLNLTNDAWYGNSAGPRQHLAAVRLRAVEEGLSIVRVANTGISAVYDPYGREMLRIGWNVKAAKAIALPGYLPPTLFAMGGQIIPLVLSMICIFIGILVRKRSIFS